ncbi:MAG: MSMEG_0570 family nitrogen starvation response protein [Betaproteobacteria bacterium]|nr:MSMEG_0570 family nitrogen starvation response protein [Betaproteobacteria bacterium]
MPEMHFLVRWPDGSGQRCYSPSLVIKDFFVPGQSYPVAEFVQRSRTALDIASERVRQKYGYGCGHAAAQLEEIERIAAQFDNRSGVRVTVEAFEE